MKKRILLQFELVNLKMDFEWQQLQFLVPSKLQLTGERRSFFELLIG